MRNHKQWLLAISLFAMILRFFDLGANSLWFHEANSVNRAKLSQRHIWSGRFVPFHPPLYYSVLHAWTGLFGTSEISVRLPSAIASMLSLVVFYHLERKLLGKDAALIVTGLLAVSPLDI
jgi:uncharacterized membrane protein